MAAGIMDSILCSVKKLLGYEPEYTEFDPDILANINAAIFSLRQLGVVSSSFSVTSETDTYADLLGADESDIFGEVAMYIYNKTKLGFDPPANSFVVEAVKEQIKEAEWRLEIHASSDTFVDTGGGENQNE